MSHNRRSLSRRDIVVRYRYLPHALFSRILGLEHHIKLFQCTSLCLHKEKVDEGELEQIPEDEENVTSDDQQLVRKMGRKALTTNI